MAFRTHHLLTACLLAVFPVTSAVQWSCGSWTTGQACSSFTALDLEQNLAAVDGIADLVSSISDSATWANNTSIACERGIGNGIVCAVYYTSVPEGTISGADIKADTSALQSQGCGTCGWMFTDDTQRSAFVIDLFDQTGGGGCDGVCTAVVATATAVTTAVTTMQQSPTSTSAPYAATTSDTAAELPSATVLLGASTAGIAVSIVAADACETTYALRCTDGNQCSDVSPVSVTLTLLIVE